MFRKVILFCLIGAFALSSVISAVPLARADALILPKPGDMVNISPNYAPLLVKGLKVHPENPLLFDFIVDTGKSGLKVNSVDFKAQSQKLINYFLASLAIKEEDMWVNLSPYEHDRIVPNNLGKTELGRDMLAQDYMLKQLTASLIYPEKELGKKFWDQVYAKAKQTYGATNIPINTFNKVWIVADKARVFEKNNTAYVVGAHLKVMLEEDYLALEKNAPAVSLRKQSTGASQVVRDIILPELEKEINQGQNFAQLRQMFYAMILATWYKTALKDAFLNKVYSNKSKTGGVESNGPAVKEKIYEQYLKAYKKGVFNYIKETNAPNGSSSPRKYFAGGFKPDIKKVISRAMTVSPQENAAMRAEGDMAMAKVRVDSVPIDLIQKPLEVGDLVKAEQKKWLGREDTIVNSKPQIPTYIYAEVRKYNKGYTFALYAKQEEMPPAIKKFVKNNVVLIGEIFIGKTQPRDDLLVFHGENGESIDNVVRPLLRGWKRLPAHSKETGTEKKFINQTYDNDFQEARYALRKILGLEKANAAMTVMEQIRLAREQSLKIRALIKELDQGLRIEFDEKLKTFVIRVTSKGFHDPHLLNLTMANIEEMEAPEGTSAHLDLGHQPEPAINIIIPNYNSERALQPYAADYVHQLKTKLRSDREKLVDYRRSFARSAREMKPSFLNIRIFLGYARSEAMKRGEEYSNEAYQKFIGAIKEELRAVKRFSKNETVNQLLRYLDNKINLADNVSGDWELILYMLIQIESEFAPEVEVETEALKKLRTITIDYDRTGLNADKLGVVIFNLIGHFKSLIWFGHTQEIETIPTNARVLTVDGYVSAQEARELMREQGKNYKYALFYAFFEDQSILFLVRQENQAMTAGDLVDDEMRAGLGKNASVEIIGKNAAKLTHVRFSVKKYDKGYTFAIVAGAGESTPRYKGQQIVLAEFFLGADFDWAQELINYSKNDLYMDVLVNKIIRSWDTKRNLRSKFDSDKGRQTALGLSSMYFSEAHTWFRRILQDHANKANSAMNVRTPGGINFNARNMGLDVDREGVRGGLTFNSAMMAEFERGDFTGVLATIIKVVPIESPWVVMGAP